MLIKCIVVAITCHCSASAMLLNAFSYVLLCIVVHCRVLLCFVDLTYLQNVTVHQNVTKYQKSSTFIDKTRMGDSHSKNLIKPVVY